MTQLARKARDVMSAGSIRRTLIAALLVAAVGFAWTPAAQAQSAPGGPVLVVVDPADQFGQFYGEILRNEGLNEFAIANVGTLSAQSLAAYQVVVLAETDLSPAQVNVLNTWVSGGGNLIAMRPDASLAGLLGLGADGGDLSNAYLQVQPGRGITGDTMQFHDTADLWSGGTASTVATLFANATQSTGRPAVTLQSVGAGQAAAFTYDLARSIVYTRQGNPAWAGIERDFALDSLTRSDDLFFGAKPGDVQPDWVDLDKVAIPQADEQQRLLADLITGMNADRMPLPRFWYLPRGEKAAVVMTGDDHANGGTAGQFARFKQQSPAGCSVANWECIRATSYVFPNTPVPGAEALEADGFEIALHLSTGCQNFTRASLRQNWAEQLPDWRAAFPTLDAPATNRTHCIAWSDWASEAIVARENGVRLDTNYYYWPASWVQNRPGMFTGSGFPMRFADTDGSLIDVYQAATQLTDESDIDYQLHIDALLDGALGPQGYYGVFTTNMHTDAPQHPGADIIVAAAKDRGVPVVSARQMLTWLDGRNGSSFTNLGFSSNVLEFSIQPGAGANGLRAMLPVDGPTGALTGVRRGGATVATTSRTVGGTEYVMFDASAGAYTASYGDPPVAPAPDTSITGLTIEGSTATASFASDVAGASFQCSLDGAPFTACGSPAQLTGLADGAHTFQVRALGPGGTDATPAARTFAIVPATSPGTGTPPVGGGEGGTPGGGVLPGGPISSDRLAPRMTLRTRRARVSSTGVVRLRAKCPQGEVRCRVRLRLRLRGRYVASKSLALAGGQTRTFRLTLRRAARNQLAIERSLRVTAVIDARDEAGNEATVRKTVRLLAPRRR
jgi:hypothetical protein